MNEHLKGPWKIVERETMEDGSVYPRHVATEAGDYQICLLESVNMAALGYSRTPAEQQRDLLIAAAPCLLAALQRLEFAASFAEITDEVEHADVAGALESAHAAIARALPQSGASDAK